ncbi:MAG: hypothetical protein IJV88_07395, partial [Ruminococcus sp.]|nr:hypothetical protein [Ruminococcus sp.]
YWGGTGASVEWSGVEMNFVETNEYGQDVYSYDVPADVTGIVFNNGIDGNTNQTVDVTEGIENNAGFYPDEQGTDGKWTVGTYTYKTDTPDETTAVPVVTTVVTTAAVLTTVPVVTDAPATTAAPVVTDAPATTAAPVVTDAPATTAAPVVTDAPATTAAPVVTDAPATTAPAVTDAPEKIEAGYYLVGSLNGEDYWSADTLTADRKLKENSKVDGEYMLDYTFYLNDEVKVVYFNGTEIETWYNDGGDNYKIGEPKVGEGTVYFMPEGNESWSYFYFTIQPKEPATDAPETTTPAATEPAPEEPDDSTVLYMKPNSNWKKDNARFAMYLWDDGGATVWVDMKDTNGDGIYEAEIPAGNWVNVIFCRMNPSATTNNWTNKWNQTSDLKIPTDGNNMYSVTGWDNGAGTWSKFAG